MKLRFCALALVILAICTTAFADIDVYFLDVGQGDSTIISCDGESMIIDGGEPGQSQFIYSYLKNTLKIGHLKYIVATHPDADHIGGLSAALNACTADIVFSSVKTHDTKTFTSLLKYTQKQGIDLTIPEQGDSYLLGDAVIDVIAAYQSFDVNNNSIVLKISYGNISFLFTGDIETIAEDAIMESSDVTATVLKVAHHGSNSSSSTEFFAAVRPEYAIISVGDNSYGHPSNDVLERLNACGAIVYRTDLNGTIICHSDGESISFSTEKDSNVVFAESVENEQITYIGNRNSKKFHYPDCSSVEDMMEKNKITFSTQDEAIDAGYAPCERCNP